MSAVAAFEVNETEQTVTILNIFYGGQDYDAIYKYNLFWVSETPPWILC